MSDKPHDTMGDFKKIDQTKCSDQTDYLVGKVPDRPKFRLEAGSDRRHFVCIRFCDQKTNQVVSSKTLV